MFLTDEELQELTGFQRRHKQREWLSAEGYPYELNGAGKPRVLRAEVERRLSTASTGGQGGAHATSRRRPRPNFAALVKG